MQKWEDYASEDDARFKNAAEELLRFVRMDIRGRILRGQGLLVLLYLASIQVIAYLYSIDALAYVPPLRGYLSIPIESLRRPWLYGAVLFGLFAAVLAAFLFLFLIVDWTINRIMGRLRMRWMHRPLMLCFLLLILLGLLFVLDGFPLMMIALFLVILSYLLCLDFGLFKWLPWAGRTWLLRRHYDTFLFAGARMNSLLPDGKDRPELHLLATNMTTGQLCSFSATGYLDDAVRCSKEPRSADSQEPLSTRPLEGGTLPVATGVAASSAFPPVFAPVVLRKKRDLKSITYSHRLTDGGVNDNLGITLLKAARQDSDLCIVSDAGAGFDADTDKQFPFSLSWIIRVIDILMRRVAEADAADVKEQPTKADAADCEKQPKCLVWDIREKPSQHVGGLAIDFAIWLEKVRTDLDRFSELEVRALCGTAMRSPTEFGLNRLPLRTLKSGMPGELALRACYRD